MYSERLRHLRTFAEILDTKFRGPMGLRFGIDAILGLIPVVGDVVTAGMSFLILTEATTLGASPSVLFRMFLNVMIENVIAIVPVIGNIFDFFWKSNTKNMELLERHLQNPGATKTSSRVFNVIFILTLTLVFIATLVGSYYLLKLIFEWIKGL